MDKRSSLKNDRESDFVGSCWTHSGSDSDPQWLRASDTTTYPSISNKGDSSFQYHTRRPLQIRRFLNSTATWPDFVYEHVNKMPYTIYNSSNRQPLTYFVVDTATRVRVQQIHLKSAVTHPPCKTFDFDFTQKTMFSIQSFIERTFCERIHTARRRPFLNGPL